MAKKFEIPPFPQVRDLFGLLRILSDPKESGVLDWTQKIVELEERIATERDAILKGRKAENMFNEAEQLLKQAQIDAKTRLEEAEEAENEFRKWEDKQRTEVEAAIADIENKVSRIVAREKAFEKNRESERSEVARKEKELAAFHESLLLKEKQIEEREKRTEELLGRLQGAGINVDMEN